ncbi:MAG TPA: hypothetical protein VGX25_19820 [Actinophytocola sp.]|uniref:hypothetical protein n=1 Tax=Actinophytocola sp. TaxID=1872138 RepID=UPI002DDD7E5E|nr:hypothetical protein [Actinophytocola sp.]HEV2781638.1 hypothetical protein [Actinophytocola sp.]
MRRVIIPLLGLVLMMVAPVTPARAATPPQVYGVWHCGNDACIWGAVRDLAEFDRQNLRPEDVDAGASIGLYLGLAIAAISVLGAVFRVPSAVRPITQDVPRGVF